MYNATEQLAEFNQAGVAQAAKFAELALASAQKFDQVNLLTAKSAFAQVVESAQAAIAVKDVQQLLALNKALVQAGMQAALGYSKNLYEIATEAQAQVAALVEESWAGYTKRAALWGDAVGQSAPAGSRTAVNALKSTVAASTAAIDQVTKATKEAVGLADASVRATVANNSAMVAAAINPKAA
jgi:phasin family protein